MARPTVHASMAEAVADIADGSTIIVPGFGGAGQPINLLNALYHQGASDLTIVSNGAGGAPGPDDRRRNVADMIEQRRVKKVIASFTAPTHPSRGSVALDLFRSGEMEAELVPQGTLAERIRAGGAGIPAFFTPAGVGTLLNDGKEHREFEGRQYVLERGIFADYALVHAYKADTAGNLVFRMAARNFNAIAAMAARHVIVEVEQPIVEAGELPPDQVHTPGIYVERLVQIGPDGFTHGERAPAQAAAPASNGAGSEAGSKRRLTRDEIVATIARRMERGWLANLGVGMPTLTSNYVTPEQEIMFTSENGVIGYSVLAPAGQEDRDVVNAGGQPVTLNPGASIVHHADSFALIRRGLLDVTVLGAYEVAADGSFANWRTSNEPFDQLGGIGGAMDLVASAKQIWLAMEHTTRDGKPRLLERCTLPVTSPSGVTLVVTDLGVIAVRDGRFVLEECAPGYSPEEIAALTGAPLEVSPALREVAV